MTPAMRMTPAMGVTPAIRTAFPQRHQYGHLALWFACSEELLFLLLFLLLLLLALPGTSGEVVLSKEGAKCRYTAQVASWR
jgi:hypothetical protein